MFTIGQRSCLTCMGWHPYGWLCTSTVCRSRCARVITSGPPSQPRLPDMGDAKHSDKPRWTYRWEGCVIGRKWKKCVLIFAIVRRTYTTDVPVGAVGSVLQPPHTRRNRERAERGTYVHYAGVWERDKMNKTLDQSAQLLLPKAPMGTRARKSLTSTCQVYLPVGTRAYGCKK